MAHQPTGASSNPAVTLPTRLPDHGIESACVLGTPAQIMNPAYAATAFYRRLLDIPNWHS